MTAPSLCRISRFPIKSIYDNLHSPLRTQPLQIYSSTLRSFHKYRPSNVTYQKEKWAEEDVGASWWRREMMIRSTVFHATSQGVPPRASTTGCPPSCLQHNSEERQAALLLLCCMAHESGRVPRPVEIKHSSVMLQKKSEFLCEGILQLFALVQSFLYLDWLGLCRAQLIK
jgi:hypothetical protein